MRNWYVATALLVAAVGTCPAHAQDGVIMLRSDPGLSACNVVDETPGAMIPVYAFHEGASAMASRWAIDNYYHTMTWVMDEVAPGATVAGVDSQRGWAVAYGGCQSSPFLIATIWYQGLGNSPPCSTIRVVPDRTETTPITGASCDHRLTFPDGWEIFVNGGSGDTTCVCQSPVEPSTWGKLKALYE